MIWLTLAGWLLRARQMASQALSWMLGSPARIFAALALCALLWGYIEHRSAAKWHTQASKAIATLNSERAAAEAAKAKAEQRYKDLAHDADQNHDALVAQGDARLAAYIAAHRVREAAQAYPASPAQGGNPAVLANSAQSPIVEGVTISEADLRTCDANYAYARAAFEWAAKLNEGK